MSTINQRKEYYLSVKSKKLLVSQTISGLSHKAPTEDEINQFHSRYSKWKKGIGRLSLPVRLVFLLFFPLIFSTLILSGVLFGDIVLSSLVGASTVPFTDQTAFIPPLNTLVNIASILLSFYGLSIEGFGANSLLQLLTLPELILIASIIVIVFFSSLWSIERSVNDIFERGFQKLSVNDLSSFKEKFAEALGGDVLALRFVADSFDSGCVVDVDKGVAVTFYSLAGELGDQTSSLIVAHRYKEGVGVNRDMDLYLQWLQHASDAGSYDATKELAELKSPSSTGSCLPYLVAGAALGIILS